MKNITLLIIGILLWSNHSFAQNYKLTYTISQDKNLLLKRINENKKGFKNLKGLKKMISNSKPIDFFILTDSKRAYSYKNKTLSLDSDAVMQNMNNILYSKDEHYYLNFVNDEFIFEKSIGSKTFHVKFQPYDFKLINSKPVMINGYNCFQAVNKTKKIKLWYTKDVSLNVGPKKYIGLPGLVVKVKINESMIISLASIKETNKKIKSVPENIELMSFEDFQETMTKSANNLFQF